VLLDRGIVTIKTVDDMFQPVLAWKTMKPFLDGLKDESGGEGYVFFNKLRSEIDKYHKQPQTANAPSSDNFT
jgi:hypothetical protein